MEEAVIFQEPGSLYFSTGFTGTPLMFAQPEETVVCSRSNELLPALDKLQNLQKQGYYCAGFLSYEAGEILLGLPPRSTNFPYLWFGAYTSPMAAGEGLLNYPGGSTGKSLDFKPFPDYSAYRRGFKRIKEHIRRGNSYQTNYTLRLRSESSISPQKLFFQLSHSHPVPYGAWINTGKYQIGSLSPELFLCRENQLLEALPMKGTAPRENNFDSDREQREWLRNSEKNRAENLMIVDLLRNDLGRVAVAGEVKVPELFRIDSYATVHQMVSKVRANLRPGVGFREILEATYPSGSVTGAPKLRTMQIIRDVEEKTRKIYTGSIGLLKPGGDFTFNVAIRTFIHQEGELEVGVGGGVVADSRSEEEWKEALLKGNFLNYKNEQFALIETMCFEPGTGIKRLKRHLERLENSCSYFTIPLSLKEVRKKVLSKVEGLSESRLLRLLVHVDGQIEVELSEFPEPPAEVKVRIASDCLLSADPFRRHKTTRRSLYNRYRRKAAEEEIFEYLFENERGEIVEGTITNLFIRSGGKLFTPPVVSGALPGIKRQEVIEEENVEEKRLIRQDLKNADAIFLTNSVRGLILVDDIQI